MTANTLDSLMQPALETVAPAITLAAYHRGQQIVNRTWGHIDPDTRQIPVTTETLFDLASLTKLFTVKAFPRFSQSGRNIP